MVEIAQQNAAHGVVPSTTGTGGGVSSQQVVPLSNTVHAVVPVIHGGSTSPVKRSAQDPKEAFRVAAASLRLGTAPDVDEEAVYKRNPLPSMSIDAMTVARDTTSTTLAVDDAGLASESHEVTSNWVSDDTVVARRRWVVCFAAAVLAAVCQWVAGDAGPMGCVDNGSAEKYHRMSVSSLVNADNRLPAPATLALIGPSGAFEDTTARQCAAKRLLVWNTICGRGSAFVFMVILDAQLRRIHPHRWQSSKLLYMPLLLEGWAITATVGDVTSAMILYFLPVYVSTSAAMASAFGLMLRVTQHAVWFGYWTFFAAALVGACMRVVEQRRRRTPHANAHMRMHGTHHGTHHGRRLAPSVRCKGI